MRDAGRTARRLLGKLLLVATGLALCGLGCLAITHTVTQLGHAAGNSATQGSYIRHLCPPWQQTAPDTCPGKFVPDHGEPVHTFTFEEDVPPRGVFFPVWCEAGACHPTGTRAVSYWLGLTLAALAVMPVGLLTAAAGVTDLSTRDWIFPWVPGTIGVLLAAASLCLLVSGKGADGTP